MIRLEGVEKRYGPKQALLPFDLHVPGGAIVALLGANGAGKSTALAIAAGQVIPDAGRVSLGVHDLVQSPRGARRVLGYLPQDSPLPRALSVEETLGFFADVRGTEAAETAPFLALAGLEAERATLAGDLSGGMRRKLAFASTLLGRGPRAFVLDEPFVGLDEVATSRFEDALRARRDDGSGVLLASHDLTRTLALVDEVVVLAHGRVALRGPSREVSGADVRSLLTSPSPAGS